jgi:hypothetical protein
MSARRPGLRLGSDGVCRTSPPSSTIATGMPDHEAAQQAADYLLGDAWEETGDGPDTKLA